MEPNKINIRDNIITLFGIDKMPEGEQEETISRIGGIIFQAVLVRALPLLGEQDTAEYEKMMDQNAGPDALLGFLFEKVPEFLDIVAEETENFRKESAGIMDQIK